MWTVRARQIFTYSTNSLTFKVVGTTIQEATDNAIAYIKATEEGSFRIYSITDDTVEDGY